MEHSCKPIALLALASLAVSPAFGQPAKEVVIYQPGTYFVSGLTRLGNEFFGSAIKSEDHEYHGIVYRLTPPSAPGGSWAIDVIYDFPPLKPQEPGTHVDLEGKVAVDNERRIFGVGYGRHCVGSCYYQFIYMLQPPASGTDAWTETIVWKADSNFRTHLRHDGLVTDGKGNLFGTAYAIEGCPADLHSCGGVYEMSPNVDHTSWTLSFIYRQPFPSGEANNAELDPVFDTFGNVFVSTLNGVVEISPPVAPGGSWTHRNIWISKAGQLQTPSGILVGPDGNLIVTAARGAEANNSGGGLFKLVRPPTQTGKWIYRAMYSTGSGGAGTFPWPAALIDKTGSVFFHGFSDFVRLTPPASLGQSWTPTELFRANEFAQTNEMFPITSDSDGDILFASNSNKIYALTGSGFVPQGQ